MKNHTLLFLLLAACKSSNAGTSNATPCDTGAPPLAKRLADANGYNMDLSAPDTKKKIDAAKAGLANTKVAFKSCRFKMQGNDQVTFAGATGDDIDCTMADGEAGVTALRHAAMDIDMEKLRLDVTGTIQQKGDRFSLAGCKITAHE